MGLFEPSSVHPPLFVCALAHPPSPPAFAVPCVACKQVATYGRSCLLFVAPKHAYTMIRLCTNALRIVICLSKLWIAILPHLQFVCLMHDLCLLLMLASCCCCCCCHTDIVAAAVAFEAAVTAAAAAAAAAAVTAAAAAAAAAHAHAAVVKGWKLVKWCRRCLGSVQHPEGIFLADQAEPLCL